MILKKFGFSQAINLIVKASNAHRPVIVTDDRIKILAEFVVLLTGLNFGVLFVDVVTASTRNVLDSSVIFAGLIVEYEDGVGNVVDFVFDVVVSLQNAAKN